MCMQQQQRGALQTSSAAWYVADGFLTCAWHLCCVVRVLWYKQTSTQVLLWYKEPYSEPRPLQRLHAALTAALIAALAIADLPRLLLWRLLALKRKEMRPAQPLTPKLAYISASFVIPLYKTLAYHVHIHLCHAVMPMAGRDCMTCVCYFLSALTEPRTCISST